MIPRKSRRPRRKQKRCLAVPAGRRSKDGDEMMKAIRDIEKLMGSKMEEW